MFLPQNLINLSPSRLKPILIGVQLQEVDIWPGLTAPLIRSHIHTHALDKQKTLFLFTVQGSKISFHLHPFGEYWAATVSSTFSGNEAGIKRVPRLPRLAFEIISRTRCWTGFWDLSILDILRYSVLSLVFIWFWLARCILHYRTAVVVGRPTSSSLTSWHLSGSVHLLFILFCSSHSAVFGFSWKPAASNL